MLLEQLMKVSPKPKWGCALALIALASLAGAITLGGYAVRSIS